MPPTIVRFYADENGDAPALRWIQEEVPPKAALKMLDQVERLRAAGHALRRPYCEYLGEGIYELRVRHTNVHYRLLYFFRRNAAALIAHGLTKEDRVPPREINIALRRKSHYEADPQRHTYLE